MAQSNGVMQWTANTLINNPVPSGGYTVSNSTGVVDASLTINQGKMIVSVPLEINGLDVEQVLKDLMQVTGVISRNRKLEEKYKGLKEAGDRYQALLQKVRSEVNIVVKEAAQDYRIAEEKYKVFETIKDSK